MAMSTGVLVLCLIIVVVLTHNVGAAPTGKKNQVQESDAAAPGHSLLDKHGRFEGDIIISEELIRKYYNISGLPASENDTDDEEDSTNHNSITKRGATSLQSLLWPNATIFYRFAPGIGSSQRHLIRRAMDHWENQTCLRFILRNTETNYVEYRNDRFWCFSNLGMQGGKQIINVHSIVCPFGTVVHEIGHAVGFWHEQSRPDRDSYIRVNRNNIQFEARRNFLKRNMINSLGSEYDYGSIMHYPTTAFVRPSCPGCQSIEVTNSTAYQAQGSPTLGQINGLSSRDVAQARSLYSCPSASSRGNLRIYARHGRNLPEEDIWQWWNDSDPYLEVIAYDANGNSVRRKTRKIQGDENPDWNQWLLFGTRSWQRFKVRVYDSDIGSDDALSISRTWYLNSRGSHTHQRLNCYHGYVLFDYHFDST